MANESAATDSPLVTLLHTLAAFEPGETEVISLYLDLRADQHGRDTHDVFLRRVFSASPREAETGSGGATAEGMTQALERIERFLSTEVDPSANAAAIFTTTGDEGLFEARAFNASLAAHQCFVGPVPHLYPLARLIDQYPRYAALLLDSNRARIIVFGLGAAAVRTEVSGEKTRRHSMGGWSQARYQRRTENIHLHHIKEVVDTLEGVVRDEAIAHVIVAGDTTIVARLREQLPAALAEKVVDVVRLDRHADEDAIVQEAMQVLRKKDADSDADRVAEVIGAWRGAGLGVAGPDATLKALQLGQVDELLIAAAPGALKPVQRLPDDAAAAPSTVDSSNDDGAQPAQFHLADELVTRAAQTGASVRMIEDAALLEPHGGVAAALRFRI